MSLLATLRSFTLVLAASALGACSSSAPSAQEPTTPATVAGKGAEDPSCPVTVRGTSVSVEDTATGAALVFVTTSDVAELRRRVGAMAEKHNTHHAAMGPLPDGSGDAGGHAGHDMGGHAGHDMGGSGAPAGHDMSGMIGVHTKAVASDVEGGARITFVAGGADVATLQGELRMHAQHFASGTCAMEKP